MSAFDLNQASTPFEENDDDRERDHLPIHNSNSNSFSCPNLFATNLHHQSADYCMSYQFHQPQQEPKELFFIPGSNDRAIPHPTDGIKLSLCDPYGAAEDETAADGAGKYWMSSKMRLMRKMMNSTTQIIVSKSMENMTAGGDHGYKANGNRSGNDSSSPGCIVRVCSDCKTTKTPLWRSGPRGPKSLCNACGIRQRKARRAMAAAAALNGGVIPAAAASVKVRKEKKLDIDRTLPFKKRCKMNYTATTTTTNNTSTAAAKKLCFEDHVTLSSNKNSAVPAIQKAFPEDERDAAVLLMALSCGLIRS